MTMRKLKSVLSTLISSEQISYAKIRFIGKNGWLNSHIIEFSGLFNIEEFLLIVDMKG